MIEGRGGPARFNPEQMRGMEELYDPRDAHTYYTFTPTDLITQDGFGRIFKATEKKTGNAVAIKFTTPRSNQQEAELGTITMIRELELSYAQLKTIDSSYILHATDVVSDPVLGFGLVTPWAEGGTLDTHMDKLPDRWDMCASYAIQIALGLAKLHEHGIVNRDLKPENVFVLSQDTDVQTRCAIGDFGISAPDKYLQKRKRRDEWDSTDIKDAIEQADADAIWGDRLTPVNTYLGTLKYSSPEQTKSLRTSYTSDLFTLGIMLYEMTTGEHPFDESLHNKLHKEPNNTPPIGQTDPYKTRKEDMMQIIRALLIKHVSQRGLLNHPLSQRQKTFFEKMGTLLFNAPAYYHISPKTLQLDSAQKVAQALAECWKGSGLPIEETPWFKEALGTT